MAVLNRQQHRPHWLEVTVPNKPAATPGDSHKWRSHYSYSGNPGLPDPLKGRVGHTWFNIPSLSDPWMVLLVEIPVDHLISLNTGAKSLFPAGDLGLLSSVSGTGPDIFFMKHTAQCQGRQRKRVGWMEGKYPKTLPRFL